MRREDADTTLAVHLHVVPVSEPTEPTAPAEHAEPAEHARLDRGGSPEPPDCSSRPKQP